MQSRDNFRLDRSLSVGLFGAAIRMWRSIHRSGIPILMYHGIRSEKQSAAHPYYEISTSPEVFTEHMHYLQREDYRVIGLGEAIAALQNESAPSNAVVITFDDGYLDFYTTAFPILISCGFTATVFVVSDFPGSRAAANGNHYMSWMQLREVYSQGIDIGSHTATHCVLQQLGAEQIDWELRQSKQMIEQQIGASIRCFSYPYAFPEHDRRFIRFVRAKLEAIGYEGAVSTVIGTANSTSDRFVLPRFGINSYDDPRLFAAKLERAYDWMHAAQWIHKRVMSPSQWKAAQV